MPKKFLYQALKLAQSRRGFCAPNPSVGALIVKNDRVLAKGCHWEAGLPHAEQIALSNLGEKAHGTSLYVTLEPCCHWGKTPPCVNSVIENGIKEVFIGMKDPNPRVCGKSIELLGKAGIPCQLIELPEIKTFYQSYSYWVKNKRPWVTTKLALSLDLKIAAEHGHPAKVTGKDLETYTHLRRQKSDAILTTTKTLKQGNPQLNARIGKNIHKKTHLRISKQVSITYKSGNLSNS